MYIDRSLSGDPKKYKLIDELSFKNCMRLNIETTRKFFVGITYKKRKFIIHPEYFDANNIFSHSFIHNIKHKPNMVQYLSIQMNMALKKIDWRTMPNRKYTKYYVSLAGMVKHNTVDGRM